MKVEIFSCLGGYEAKLRDEITDFLKRKKPVIKFVSQSESYDRMAEGWFRVITIVVWYDTKNAEICLDDST